MSSPGDSEKKAPAVRWETIARVADEAKRDAADELGAMDDAAIDAELGAAGFEGSTADEVVAAALAAGKKPVRAPARRAVPWTPVAMATAVALVLVLVWKRDAVVAVFTSPPPPITPDHVGPPVPTPPPLRLQAMELRKQAFTDCDSELWALCQDELDRASALDPAGDTEPDVKAARAKLAPHVPTRERDVGRKPR